MQLVFKEDSPLNSTVVDTASGRDLYQVTSKAITGSENVRMRTVVHDLQQDLVVAVWERRHGSERAQDWITYHSTAQSTLADWLPGIETLSRPQTFIAPDGEQYAWERVKAQITKTNKDAFKLMHVETQKTIAETHQFGVTTLRPHERPGLSLDIASEAEGMAEAILLAFIIVEQLSREEEETTIGAFGMSSVLGMNTARLVGNITNGAHGDDKSRKM